MKKIMSFVLAAVMVMSLVGCGGGEKEALKLGLGVSANIAGVTDADELTNGSGEVIVNVAAVTLNKDGKIVACELDTVDIAAGFDAEGKYVAEESFKTKYEYGKDYGMVAYGGAAKEWFEQADAFESVVEGKTVAEVKALLADDNYTGNDEVIKAGCTIGVVEFIDAIDKAVANAEDSSATADDTLKLGIAAAQGGTDASEEAEGANKVEINVAAAVVGKDGKTVAIALDAVDAEITFDASGVCTSEAGALSTKREIGKDYGMVAYGGAAKEWFEQVDALEAACAGKTAAEVSALLGADSYTGNDEVVKAGCTIGVANLLAAAVKAVG